jgi:twitching motility protein PilT
MRSVPLEGDLLKKVLGALGHSTLFRGLDAPKLETVAGYATLVEYQPGEPLTREGEPSDSFFVLLQGEATVSVDAGAEPLEIARLGAYETVGEMGVVLRQKRSATVAATGRLLALRFDAERFRTLFDRVPGFALSLCTTLAGRVHAAFRRVPIPDLDESAPLPDAEVLEMLPMHLLERHQVVPVAASGNVLTLGFVHDPLPHVIEAVRRQLPGVELRPVRIEPDYLERVLGSATGSRELSRAGERAAAEAVEARPASPKLDALLERVVAEGASDLHLSARQPPRWRIHGDMAPLDARPLGDTEVLEMLLPVMHERNRKQFEADNDTDFAHALRDVARFRVNLFRDMHGVGAVLRQIPTKIVSIEQLGLPRVTRQLCEHPKGLVLVTGPTGSGKSTSLAAMIDHINRSRKTHIITLEDPIEFVHKSRLAMVNQREVGTHTTGFARALRAALREDPDIVLVGEMRDLETIELALETANTGHLVFATLHTATAVTTIDRIINVFSADEQPQVRASLAEVLRGVIAQTLCRRVGGGRIGVFETLIVNPAVSNLIREGKTFQIPSIMATGKQLGNTILNDELARLVHEEKIEFAEAFTKALDKADLAKKCGRELPKG